MAQLKVLDQESKKHAILRKSLKTDQKNMKTGQVPKNMKNMKTCAVPHLKMTMQINTCELHNQVFIS